MSCSAFLLLAQDIGHGVYAAGDRRHPSCGPDSAAGEGLSAVGLMLYLQPLAGSCEEDGVVADDVTSPDGVNSDFVSPKPLPLPEAIRRMTGLPAHIFGLEKRGLVKSGYSADVVVFDPDGVRNNAGYSEPCLSPSGIYYVVQNGVLAVEKGKILSLCGKVLRKHG